MNRTLYALSMISLLVACSGSSSPSGTPAASEAPVATGSTNTSLKVLASNVIMGTAQAADGVDTTTKVLASNVTLDNKGLGITSSNVQDAFGETQPDPSTVLVGKWVGTNTCGDTRSGSITFTINADGTYSCTSTSNISTSTASILDGQYGLCASSPTTWAMIGKRTIKFSKSGSSSSSLAIPILYLSATHLELELNFEFGSCGVNVAILDKQTQ